MKNYEIDFGGHLKCAVTVDGENITVVAAVNGYGVHVEQSEINIAQQPKPKTEIPLLAFG